MKIERALAQKISRRAFLTSSAVVGAGLVVACGESKIEKLKESLAPTTQPEIQPTPTKETEQFRLLWQQSFRRGKYSGLENYRRGERRFSPFLFGTDGIYLTNSAGQFTKLDTETGTPLWPTPWENAGTPLIEDSGVVAVARQDLDRFYGLNSKDGTEVWKYKADAQLDRTPVVFDDLIYFIDKFSSVYVGESFFKVGEIDAKTGNVAIKLQWPPNVGQQDITDYGVSAYTLYGDFAALTNERIILKGINDPWLVLDRNTGSIVWGLSFGIFSNIILTQDKDKIVLKDVSGTYGDRGLKLIDTATGNIIWQMETDREVDTVVKDKILLTKQYSPFVDAINLHDGSVAWQLEGEPIVNQYGGVDVLDFLNNKIYIKSSRGDSILAVDISSGTILWENDEVTPGQLLAADDQGVFVFTKNGDIVALNSQTGERLWKFEFGASISQSSLTDEALIFGTSQVFVIDRKTGQYLQSPIPVGDPVIQIHQKDNKLFVESSETLTVLG